MAVDVATANLLARMLDTAANRATGAGRPKNAGEVPSCPPSARSAGVKPPTQGQSGTAVAAPPADRCRDCIEFGVEPGCYCRRPATEGAQQ